MKTKLTLTFMCVAALLLPACNTIKQTELNEDTIRKVSTYLQTITSAGTSLVVARDATIATYLKAVADGLMVATAESDVAPESLLSVIEGALKGNTEYYPVIKAGLNLAIAEYTRFYKLNADHNDITEYLKPLVLSIRSGILDGLGASPDTTMSIQPLKDEDMILR